MYYIVETEQQLKRLHCSDNECYIRIIPMNDEYHSILTSPCLVYFKTLNGKGYMFPINHSEAFKLSFDMAMVDANNIVNAANQISQLEASVEAK